MRTTFLSFIFLTLLKLSAVHGQCEFFQNYTGIIATIAANSVVGQSFQMNCANGDNAFESITINHQTPSSVNGTLRIYAGETYTGTPLYQQPVYIAAQGANVHKTIQLSGGIGSLMFEEGQMYTITFVFDRNFRWNGRTSSLSPARALWPNNGGTWVTHFDYFYRVETQYIVTDSDGDGVDDSDDDCPNTPAGESVNADGCSCTQVTVDDGNPCTLDECVDGIVTHTYLDTDGDGVCDYYDICPGGDDNADNDTDGTPDFCDSDDDNDGILDDCDSEPFIDNFTYNGFNSLPTSWICGNNNNKVLVCHGSNNPQTNCVSPNAVQTHLNHGDYLGACTCTNQNYIVPGSAGANTSIQTEQLNLELSPNPVSNFINLHLHGVEREATLTILDNMGRIVWRQSLDSHQHEVQIDITGNAFHNGIYLISLISQDEKISRRLVIAK